MRSFFFAAFFSSSQPRAQAADTPAQPVASPIAAPAFLDVVSFEFRADGENHKVVVTPVPPCCASTSRTTATASSTIRKRDHYTGLEHRNYTYWEFSWPEVRAAVENSKRYETRLQELGNEGIERRYILPPSTQCPGRRILHSAGGDDSGYVWRPTTDKKRIADLDCVRWTGETVSGESVEAWCYRRPAAQGSDRRWTPSRDQRTHGAGAGPHHRARLYLSRLRRADQRRRHPRAHHLGR